MRFFVYVILSMFSLLANVYYAYYTKQQFYPTIYYLVSSKLSMIVIGNAVLALSLVTARIIKSIYFGTLRPTEIEVLVEKAKYSIIDTCLALTIFRNDFNARLLMQFGFLIFMKLLHRLARARMEYMEQITPVPASMGFRMVILLLSMLCVDTVGVLYAMDDILEHGRSVLILFGFEFGLLAIYAMNLTVRFLIQQIDAQCENGLQSRGFLVMLTDVLSEGVKVVINVAFFVVVFQQYGMPIHLIRDVWVAYYSFHKKVVGVLKYLQLVRNLQARFPDATGEELQAAGDCLVCREALEAGKKLPCGHVFHFHCLKSWLQHQQSCPLCRSDIPSGETPATVDGRPAPAPAPGPAPAPAPAPAPVVGDVQGLPLQSQQQPLQEPSHAPPTPTPTPTATVAATGRLSTTTTFSSSSPPTDSTIGSPNTLFPKFFVVVSPADQSILTSPCNGTKTLRTVKTV
jgi:E3 ubiquitin-protein ligase synoviolin